MEKSQDIAQRVKSYFSYYKRLRSECRPGYKDKTDEELFDEAIRDAFWLLRHWFHYKVPKWLNVINSLQEFVCKKNSLEPGNYTYFSTQIENDFVRENLSILVEYGIPKSAIDKLQKRISASVSEDDVLRKIEDDKLVETSDLLEYEKEKIRANLYPTD
jgi:hypothetical protein